MLLLAVGFVPDFLIDSVVAIAAGVIRKKKLTRLGGIFMLLCYAGYFTYLLLK